MKIDSTSDDGERPVVEHHSARGPGGLYQSHAACSIQKPRVVERAWAQRQKFWQLPWNLGSNLDSTVCGVECSLRMLDPAHLQVR